MDANKVNLALKQRSIMMATLLLWGDPDSVDDVHVGEYAEPLPGHAPNERPFFVRVEFADDEALQRWLSNPWSLWAAAEILCDIEYVRPLNGEMTMLIDSRGKVARSEPLPDGGIPGVTHHLNESGVWERCETCSSGVLP